MLARIKAIFREYGYILNIKPYQLNIVGVRSKSVMPNAFDDEIHIFYTKEDGSWNYHVYPITTDPGTFWLENPSMEKGTAILAQGQYVDSHAIGEHRGQYKALVQVKPVTVLRDYDRDSWLDFSNGTRDTGNFGINIHRASSQGITKSIDKYSAGCQVFQNVEDFNVFMSLCEKHRRQYGNKFNYTLIDFRAIRRVTLRRIVAIGSIAAAGLIGWLLNKDLAYEHPETSVSFSE